MGFKIGKESAVFMDCTFDCAQNLSIGENSVINAKCRIDSRGGINIGNNVSISNEVTILSADHDMNTDDFKGRNNPVKIQDYVWIGTRAMILPGVTIEEGAVVAAGAVVSRDVKRFTVVGGVPAKVIGNRKEQKFNYKVSYFRLFQ